MTSLLDSEVVQVYRVVGDLVRKQRTTRLVGPMRNQDDAEEITYAVSLRLWERALKHWDRERGPLGPYIAKSAPPEILKFRQKERCRSIPQTREDEFKC